jgi:hypothetical protein
MRKLGKENAIRFGIVVPKRIASSLFNSNSYGKTRSGLQKSGAVRQETRADIGMDFAWLGINRRIRYLSAQ